MLHLTSPVFDDDVDETEFQLDNPELAPAEIRAYLQRKYRLKELLLIFVTQTSGRLNFTSMLPPAYTDPYFSKTPEQRWEQRLARIRADGGLPANAAACEFNVSTQQVVLYFWMEIAVLFETGNKQLFRSRKYTRAIITSGQYAELLAELQPTLLRWRKAFDEATGSEFERAIIYDYRILCCRLRMPSSKDSTCFPHLNVSFCTHIRSFLFILTPQSRP